MSPRFPPARKPLLNVKFLEHLFSPFQIPNAVRLTPWGGLRRLRELITGAFSDRRGGEVVGAVIGQPRTGESVFLQTSASIARISGRRTEDRDAARHCIQPAVKPFNGNAGATTDLNRAQIADANVLVES